MALPSSCSSDHIGTWIVPSGFRKTANFSILRPPFLAVIHAVAAVDYRCEPTHMSLAKEEVLHRFHGPSVLSRRVVLKRGKHSLSLAGERVHRPLPADHRPRQLHEA